MSDIPANLDLQEQIARIEQAQADIGRAQAETRKFVAEQQKLIEESLKLARERVWFPWLQLLALVASSAGIAAVVARLIR